MILHLVLAPGEKSREPILFAPTAHTYMPAGTWSRRVSETFKLPARFKLGSLSKDDVLEYMMLGIYGSRLVLNIPGV